jgi:hypothetical protein
MHGTFQKKTPENKEIWPMAPVEDPALSSFRRALLSPKTKFCGISEIDLECSIRFVSELGAAKPSSWKRNFQRMSCRR